MDAHGLRIPGWAWDFLISVRFLSTPFYTVFASCPHYSSPLSQKGISKGHSLEQMSVQSSRTADAPLPPSPPAIFPLLPIAQLSPHSNGGLLIMVFFPLAVQVASYSWIVRFSHSSLWPRTGHPCACPSESSLTTLGLVSFSGAACLPSRDAFPACPSQPGVRINECLGAYLPF